MKNSFFSMTEAKYAAGENIKHTIFDNVETAQVLIFLKLCWPVVAQLWHAIIPLPSAFCEERDSDRMCHTLSHNRIRRSLYLKCISIDACICCQRHESALRT